MPRINIFTHYVQTQVAFHTDHHLQVIPQIQPVADEMVQLSKQQYNK
jgi:hypothetical protein